MIQDEKQATYAPKISREEEQVNWQEAAETVHNRIRALDPFPGAYADFHGKRLKLFSSRIQTGQGVPGQILHITKAGITVACQEGAVLITQVQLEGKVKMAADAFARGYQIKIGGLL